MSLFFIKRNWLILLLPTLYMSNKYLYKMKGEINGYPMSINLEKKKKKFLWENEKVIEFLSTFYISHRGGIKNF